MRNFQHALIFKQGAYFFEHGLQRQLTGKEIIAAKKIARAFAAMLQWNIASPPRRGG